MGETPVFSFFGPKAPPKAPLLPPEVPKEWEPLAELLHPRYQLVRELQSEGHFSQVLARDTAGRQVVVCVSTALGYGSDEVSPRLRRDLQVAESLRHRSIVPVWEVGDYGPWPLWVRPWIDGHRLSSVLQGAPLPHSRVRLWLRQLVEALQHAHSLGVVHRGLEPDCIWITDGGERVQVAGFGTTVGITNEMHHAGSPAFERACYLSPEFIVGQQATAATDFYCLGVIAFEMLTATRPFTGPDAVQVIIKAISEAPPRVTSLRPEVPQALADLVEGWLLRDPAERSVKHMQLAHVLQTELADEQPCEAAAELLEQLRSEGERLTADSRWTLDPAAALEKLRQYQFAEPDTFLLALCAAAEPLGCSRLEMRARGDLLKLTYHDVRVSRSELENLWAYAFSTDASRGLRHMALGLAGFLGHRCARVKVTSSGCAFALNKLEPPRTSWFWRGPLTIELHGAPAIPVEYVSNRFCYSAVQMSWNGKLLPRRAGRRSELIVGDRVYHVAVDVQRTVEWLGVADGMSFLLPPRTAPSGQVVVWGEFSIDLSYGHLVHNQHLTALLEALEGPADAALEDYAALGRFDPVVDEALLRHVLSRWDTRDEQERIRRLYADVLRKEKPGKLVWPALKYFENRSDKPAVFWHALITPAHLRTYKSGDWSSVLEVAENAFSRREAALNWTLDMWLGQGIQPGLEQGANLLRRCAEFPDVGSYRDRQLQRAVRGGLLKDATQEEMRRFAGSVPPSWSVAHSEVQRWIDGPGK